ncbi:hypothetical protein ACJRO7_031005, partial [Eucalyptus globulus]
MASPSSKPRRSYHVFLSFKGSDIRNSFLGHLYIALKRVGIYTYIDSEELRKGEQISPSLMRAIEKSQIAIVIFSEGYVSSPWCLEEVAKIMECKEQGDLMVFPVFYKVEPREVRTPRESYKEAIAKHESKFGKHSEEVERWKKALFDASNLSGWDLNDGDEAELVRRIVKEISMQLDRIPLYVAKHPVGIHPQVVKLESMINMKSADEVLFIGLWGKGGIGKTTLAKALHNAIFRQFEGSCFLANIREASKDSKDLVPLQGKLLSEILLGQELTVYNVDGGINLIQERLCHKKVLLILDDVDEVKQLDDLAGECEWFGEGSRVIITSRDRHLLTSHGIDEDRIYEVKTLENCEALELFNKHAFVRNNKNVIRRDLVNSVLQYANGLPLALEVLGRFLRGRREREWESALSKLAKSPNEKINGVLKLSYDGLEHNEKEIFLDIACFFKGQTINYIMKVLGSCDLDPTIGIQVLVEKSLTFYDGGTLQMHDLIQLMGMDIVKQECHDDPGKRSRLWLYDDIHYVMSGKLGTSAVKAIVLDLPEPKEIYIGPAAFINMRRLRVLIMINVLTSFQGPIYLPNELRWLEWPECPWNPELCSGPKNLVGLDLRRSNIQVVREQFKDFKKLKFLNFSKCQSLVCMPDLNCTPNLEELNFHGCKNLERAHESVAYHGKLRLLNLSGCSELHHLCDVLQAKNLQSINLSDCSKLQRFPNIPDKKKGLQNLHLDRTPIKELLASIENLVSLEHMTLSDCKNLAILPSSIYKLQNLERLVLDGCSNLINFPKQDESSDPHKKIGFPKLKKLSLRKCNLSEVDFLEKHSCFSFLRDLNLSGNNFTSLSISGQLHNLLNLDVSYCQQLQEVLKIPGQLRKLVATNCESLHKISANMGPMGLMDLSSCYELARHGFSVNDLVKPKMPKWLLPQKEGYIYFLASKDLYEKIRGLALGVAIRAKEGKKNTKFKQPSHWIRIMWLFGLSNQETGGEKSLSVQMITGIISITTSGGMIVKKFGLRLLCKSFENEREVLLQDDQLLDLALFHEVLDENQTITEKDSPSKFVHKGLDENQTSTEEDSPSKFVHKGLNMTDFSIEKGRYSQISPTFQNVLLGGEMLEQFILVEDGTIYFMASQDLYEKFLGLALCVVFSVEDGEKEISFEIVPHVYSERRN